MSSLPTFLDELAPQHREEARSAFTVHTLLPGELLIAEHATTDCAYVLVEGRVVVEVGGAIVATLEPVRTLGEIALFTQVTRTASVRASTPCTVWKLDRDAFERLRERSNPVVLHLERRALQQLLERLKQPLASLQAAAYGAPSLRIAILWGSAWGTEVPLPPSAPGLLLRSCSCFDALPHRHLRQIAVGAVLRVLGVSETVGEPEDGPALHILLEGELDLVVPVPHGDRDEGTVAARIAPGTLFNIHAVWGDSGGRRRFVTRTSCSILTLDPEQTTALLRATSPAGSTLRHGCIRSLFSTLRSAEVLLRGAPQRLTEAGPSPVLRDDPDDGDLWLHSFLDGS